jgi:hypothetical protein
MTASQMLETVKTLIGEDPQATDAVLSVFIQKAEDMIANTLYPTGNIPEGYATPLRYHMLACQIAVAEYSKQGAEGETVHIENGIHRTYRATTSDDLLKFVIPYAGVVG